LKTLSDRYKTPQQKEQYITNLFSSIEKNYDFTNRVMSLGLDMGWRKKAIQKANFNDESLLLDVAAGTGDMSLAALKIKPEAQIIGLDFCRPLLQKAQSKFEKTNPDKAVNWIEGNGLQLPFKDASFDGAFTGFSLRNVAEVKTLFSELYRITKPGGKIVSLEMVKQHQRIPKLIFAIHFKRIVPFLGNLLSSNPEAYSYLPLSIENFFTADKLTDEISSVGWHNVTYKLKMFGFVAIHVGEKLKV